MSTIAAAQRFAIATTEEIRAQFPALERRQGSVRVAYFDGPGGTQVPKVVVDAMADYLLHHNANTHWAYPSSVETDEAIAAARSALADFLGAEAGEIVFGQNMTTLTFHLARALGRGFAAGDMIVVTELDHHANVDPWRALERERGVLVERVRVLPDGTLDWNDLERRMEACPKLLAIGAASNAVGTITDVTRACALAREAGALSFVDAVHYAPHLAVDVRAIGCDFLACSPYKFYGPHLGALYGRRELLASLDAPKLEPAPDTAPERLETGTLSHEAIVGAAAAVNFLAGLARAPGANRRERLVASLSELHHRSIALFARLWDGLAGMPRVRRYGLPPHAPRTPTAAFTVDGMPAEEVARALARRGVFLSHGDFYAATAVRVLGGGNDGFVRAGCACYTTGDEVDRLLAALASL